MTQRKRAYDLMRMVAMRLNLAPTDVTGFANITAFEPLDKDFVLVWVVTKDAKSVVIEDDAAMFPSDALLVKLRLLREENNNA